MTIGSQKKLIGNPRPLTDHSLPFVSINMAMTADGKIATANRTVSTFGSPRDHRHLLLLRSKFDAVMAGARTVDLSPVNLGPGSSTYRSLRLKSGLAEYNLRIIVSGSGTINPEAEIFRHRFSPVVVLTTGRASRTKLKHLRSVASEIKICGAKEIDFAWALRWLRKKWGVTRLLCEGGGELNGALFAAGLVNELNLTICGKIIGGRTSPTIADGKGANSLAKAAPLTLKTLKRIGCEMFLVWDVSSSPA
jgi:2,5-diamino-6-(ribosylamino)-4(3H)-pyrimidinone 5'-phosphate reductase